MSMVWAVLLEETVGQCRGASLDVHPETDSKPVRIIVALKPPFCLWIWLEYFDI